MSSAANPTSMTDHDASERLRAALADPTLLREQGFIDGAWADADDRGTFSVDDPATGQVIAAVPAMGATETRRAIEAAARAFGSWSRRPAKERGALLRALASAMTANADDLARIMTAEHGKPVAESKGEIAYAASFLEWFAEEARRFDGAVIASPLTDRRLVVLRQPVGVTAGITPWNFPAAMITRKLAPALAVGCTIVVKPAEQTPLSALALAELASRVGIPDGVLNIVTGSADGAPAIGGELTSNPIVRKLSFTGSTAVGKLLTRQCADTLKKVSMELGGNAPFIVFEDADLDAAVAGAMVAKFRNTGQACTAANRFLIHRDVKPAFVEKFAAAIRSLVVGNGVEPGVTIGPLIDDAAVEKVRAHIADAIAKGARVVLGGTPHPLGGRFVAPTLLDDVAIDAQMCCEETFGPVAGITGFADEAEALELANATPYGLTSYVYTKDYARTWRVAEAIESGMVAINTGLLSTAEAPFGGVKESGLGREGSRWGMDDWSELKYVAMAGL